MHFTNHFFYNNEPQIKLCTNWKNWKILYVLSCKSWCKVDQNINFRAYIFYITSKLSKNTGIFHRIRDNLPAPARIIFYYALLFPFMSYDIIIWGGKSRSHLYLFICQQKNNYKTDSKFIDHTNKLFYEHKILKLDDIYKYFLRIYMFKAKKRGIYATQNNVNTRSRDLAQS